VTRRGPGFLLLAAVFAAGCAEDRPRPAPPILSIEFQRDSVFSPDTLRGTLHAADPAGIDSLWLVVGEDSAGVDGGFNFTFDAPFLFPIDSGFLPGVQIPVTFRARNIIGYTDALDTFVVIKRGP